MLMPAGVSPEEDVLKIVHSLPLVVIEAKINHHSNLLIVI